MESRHKIVSKLDTPPKSPIPPEIDDSAPDSFFDSLHSICRSCFRFQIHGMANEKGLKYLMLNYNKNNQ